jgi:hypothetical protein
MIRYFLFGFLATVILSLISVTAFADDRNWQKSEHNVNIKHNNFGLNIRQYAQDDYDHIQFQYKLMKNVNVALRLAEEGVIKEKRPIVTHKINDYISHRLEYRTYESDLKSDYMRYRIVLGAKYKMLWAKVQPRWKVGGEGVHVDGKIDDIKTAVGLSFKLNKNTTLKPYVEYLADSEINNYKKKYMMLGTALTFKF